MRPHGPRRTRTWTVASIVVAVVVTAAVGHLILGNYRGLIQRREFAREGLRLHTRTLAASLGHSLYGANVRLLDLGHSADVRGELDQRDRELETILSYRFSVLCGARRAATAHFEAIALLDAAGEILTAWPDAADERLQNLSLRPVVGTLPGSGELRLVRVDQEAWYLLAVPITGDTESSGQLVGVVRGSSLLGALNSLASQKLPATAIAHDGETLTRSTAYDEEIQCHPGLVEAVAQQIPLGTVATDDDAKHGTRHVAQARVPWTRLDLVQVFDLPAGLSPNAPRRSLVIFGLGMTLMLGATIYIGRSQLRNHRLASKLDEEATRNRLVTQQKELLVRQMEQRALYEVRLRDAKTAAERASKAKSMFLANMSHEIRTPLNGVLGLADLTLETKLDEEQREYVETIRDSGRALLEVINDILDFSKIEAGRMEVASEAFALRAAVDGVSRMLSPKARQKNVEFEISVSDDIPDHLLGDPMRLRQVLINLLGNSLKFTDDGKIRLAIALAAQGHDRVRLLFEVQDTGIGISQDQQKSIFEAFRQADGSASRTYGGTGLGLTISSRLVRLMGGKLELESAPDHGSTFSFTLPFDLATDAVRSEETGSTTVSQRPLRVLVAEDNPVNQKVVTKLLDKWGHTSVVVTDGEAAVRAWYDDPFDVILMDVKMPRLDGIEATRRIRRAESERDLVDHVPIVALTAAAFAEDERRCRDAGMDAFVSKPLKSEELRRVLGQLTEIANEPIPG